MGFRRDHFGEGFDRLSQGARAFNNQLLRGGITATWWRRTRGSQDATTGYEAITWDSTKITLKIFFEPVSSSNVDTPGGVVDEQRGLVHSATKIPQFDRIVFGGDTYEVENEPRTSYFMNAVSHYVHTVIKRS